MFGVTKLRAVSLFKMAHNVLRLSAVRIFEILVMNSDSGYYCPYSRKPFVSRSCRVIIKAHGKENGILYAKKKA